VSRKNVVTRVLAVDPGGTTGAALGVINDKTAKVSAFQMTPLDFCVWAHRFVSENADGLVIVIERFTITQRTVQSARQYDALEITGVLKYLAHIYDVETRIQQPADVMRLFSDDKLKALQYYEKGKPHANDALRHLCYTMARLKWISVKA
jgi:hypothetical protein